MKRLPMSFVAVMTLALWLGSAAAVKAQEYSQDGTITNADPTKMTFTLLCSDGVNSWPGLTVDAATFKSLNTKITYTVKFDYKGDRKGASGHGDVLSISPKQD